MTKKELRRILKNLCDEKEWTVIQPSIFINDESTRLMRNVYCKNFGNVYNIFIDTESRKYGRQQLSIVTVHETSWNSLDRFM